ncbi:MAG TPA: CAP domain-containing protein [Terriglobales bacterium]|nr:CAP domain-containing protein [Terriglobales bacterium]
MTARAPRLLLVLLAACLLPPALAPQPPAPPPASTGAELAAERELGRLLNQERARAGVPELALDPKLVEAARAHARVMAEHHHLSHQFNGEPDLRLRLAAVGVRFDNAGENIALNDNAAGAHQDFLVSVHHRENMLSPNYNVMGIGIVQRGGQLYVVEDFAYRTREYSSEEAEDVVAAAYLAFRGSKDGHTPKRLAVPLLRKRACAMAQADNVPPGDFVGLEGARSLVSYNDGRPERLPPQLTDPARGGSAKAFAVGACFARTSNHPEGIYWIQVALY